MKNVYKSIRDRLAEIAELRYIELNFGQLEGDDDQYPVHFPAALIDFERIEWGTTTQRIQNGLATVRLTVLFENYNMSSNLQPSDISDAALTEFTLLNQIQSKLQGYGSVYHNALIRRSTVRISIKSPRVYEITYQCNITDCYGQKQYDEGQANQLNADVQYSITQ